MTLATVRPRHTTLTRAVLATTVNHVPPLVVPGPLRRAAVVVGDLLAAVGIVFCIPFVILALATPVVLCVRGLLWIVGMR